MVYSNVFYFREIHKIGGTEQFLYEIAKKYSAYDITIVCDSIDPSQYERLSRLVRCIIHKRGEKIKCKKAFFNFNIDAIDDIEADEYWFVAHANYEDFGYKPPIQHEKLNNCIGVSEFASLKLMNYAKKIGKEIKVCTCYNPLVLEPREKVLNIVTACRLGDTVKGGDRTKTLVKAMDKYCEENGRHYILHIFSDFEGKIDSPNVCFMKPRTDVRPFIADADYVWQLSNDMETYCYTINEALGYGVPIVTTPLTILNELPITDNEHIVLDWDCSNVDEVVEQIFNKKVNKFEYTPPETNWEEFLDLTKSTLEDERKMKFKVRATNFWNGRIWDGARSTAEHRIYPKEGDIWIVDYFRKEDLKKKGAIQILEEIKEVEISGDLHNTEEKRK